MRVGLSPGWHREHLLEVSCQVFESQVPCAGLSQERAGWVPHPPPVPSHLTRAHDHVWKLDEWAGEGLSMRDRPVWWKGMWQKGLPGGRAR